MLAIGAILLIIAVSCGFVSVSVFLRDPVYYYGYREGPANRAAMISGAVGFLCFLLSAWILLPWFHPLFFGLFFNNLGFWIVCGVILVAAILAGLLSNSLGSGRDVAVGVCFVLFVIGVIAWLSVYGFMGGRWSRSALYGTLQYEELQQLPDTTSIRYLPMEVARQLAKNALQEPGITLGEAEPLVREAEVEWIAPRIPNGLLNSWRKKADGFAIIGSDGKTTMVRQAMQVGEGMLGSDSISWKIRKQRYFSTIAEVFYIENPAGEVVAVVPYLDHPFRFPVRVPEWGGVFLVFSNGNIQNLTPHEALKHPLLQGVRIFPEGLAKLQVEAFAYKYGIRNAIFTHRDQIRIPAVSETLFGNEMPFLLPTALGQKWFIATTPWGADGIFRIFLIDAMTGQIQVYTAPQDSSLVGPLKARTFMPTGFSTYDWSKFAVLEPRPIIRDGILYWMFTITTNEYAGVKNTVLVNSHTSEVLDFGSSRSDLLKFLAGGVAGRVAFSPNQQDAEVSEAMNIVPKAQLSAEELADLILQLEELVESLRRLQQTLPK